MFLQKSWVSSEATIKDFAFLVSGILSSISLDKILGQASDSGKKWPQY